MKQPRQPKNVSIKVVAQKGISKTVEHIIYAKAIELQELLGLPVFVYKEFDDYIMNVEIVNPIERATLPTKIVEYRDANNQ